MKPTTLSLLFSLALALAPAPSARAQETAPAAAEPSDAAVEARRAALDLAGAFSNEGFKLRDGHWSGEAKKGAAPLVQVNLFAGNEYWFSAAAAGSPSGETLTVTLFDESGAPVESEPFAEGNRAAAGFSPEVSGPYYIRLEWSGAEPAATCLVYSYK